MAFGIIGAYVILAGRIKRKVEKRILGKKQDIKKRVCVMFVDSPPYTKRR
jgi:hypothetical protein